MIKHRSILRLTGALLLLAAAGCDVIKKPASPPTAPAPVPAPTPAARPTLFEAVDRGDLALVQELVSGGSDIAAVDAERMTPLHHAALNGRTEILRYLLSQRASLEARDLYEFTPLHAAARNGHLETVQALVEAGADARATDKEKLTAFDMASLMEHGEVADYLAAHGGGPVEVATPAEPAPPPVTLLTGATFRVWTSLTGAQVEAEFVRSQFDEVQLRKRDASLVRIRLALLKPEDQILARQLAGHSPPLLVRSRGPRPTEPSLDSVGLRIGKSKEWTVLGNCKLLARDANDGDSFHVRHDGKEYIFRLYYVDTPETSLAFPDRVREQAEYFNFSEQDALRVGEEAKHFTAKVLDAAPFTVVTKWEDARGNSKLPRYYAFVVTDQGDLDELLTAEGLVRVYGMHVADNLGNRKQSTLKQLEQTAKREGAGAWGVDRHAESRP